MEDINSYYRDDINTMIANNFNVQIANNDMYVWKDEALFIINFNDLPKYKLRMISYPNIDYDDLKRSDQNDQIYYQYKNGNHIFSPRECDGLYDFTKYVVRFLDIHVHE